MSDVKESFEKNFFDSLHIYDDMLPLLMVYEFPLKYIHSKVNTVIEPSDIVIYALTYQSTVPSLRSETLPSPFP